MNNRISREVETIEIPSELRERSRRPRRSNREFVADEREASSKKRQ
ncbi:hypothetical protein [Paenibacillus sp. OSY-SE]|nr:hypothetical protein [Paenibacillus sp. OSY-SE]